ncbi:hypothetical protein H0H87_005971 [Tephrocybe sp. NHM501043]|nr:hypothetical protein H0H87_005971 [Tephrocybe sp. NHM501043]
MLEDDKRLDAAFKASCDFNPLGQHVNFYAYPKLASPLTFYDRHVDKRLSLKKVSLVPSLATNLAQAAHIAFASVKDDGAHLPSVDRRFPALKSTKVINDHGPTADAREVARRYQIETSFPASVIASMLLLHPNCPEWTESFRVVENPPPRRRSYTALNEDYAPQFLAPYTPQTEPSLNTIPKEAWDAMDKNTQEEICHARERFRFLAIWQVFYIRREARRALKRLNPLTLLDELPTPRFGTLTSPCDPAHNDLSLSPDALSTAWGISVADFIRLAPSPETKHAGSKDSTVNIAVGQPIRRSLRLSTKIDSALRRTNPRLQLKVKNAESSMPAMTSVSERVTQWSDVTIPYHEGNTTYSDEEMATLILQHAWARAVEKDSTFIVLHCGNYERIAFRHRSSRTLFISELINVGKCSSPSYGAIHIGLFISIIKDVLDRTRRLIDVGTAGRSKKRKRQAPYPQDMRKRPKTRAIIAQDKIQKLADKSNFNAVCAEVAPRLLALLRIQHSHFNSSVPASFLRHGVVQSKGGKLVYEPKEYFCITLTSPLGVGGTGDAHEGIIDLLSTSGDTLSLSKVVVKFAFHPSERQRLRHEFKVYEHLKLSGVTGIPYHFGLFKDVESDTLALVMTKGGTSLPDRKPQVNSDQYDPSFSVSESERAGFIKVLESIHSAGVRHRDIRGDNLVVSDDGVVNIIDFDRASMKSSEETMQREMDHLISTLDGNDFTGVGLEFISFGSFRESAPPSVERRKSWEKSDDDSDRTRGSGPMLDSDMEELIAAFSGVESDSESESEEEKSKSGGVAPSPA